MELGQSLGLYLKRVSSTGGNSLVLKYLCNTENRVIASNDSGNTVSFPLTSLSMKAWIGSTITTQLGIICWKSIIVKLEQGVKYANNKVNNKDTRRSLLALFWC